jgi:hypothetical protein
LIPPLNPFKELATKKPPVNIASLKAAVQAFLPYAWPSSFSLRANFQ